MPFSQTAFPSHWWVKCEHLPFPAMIRMPCSYNRLRSQLSPNYFAILFSSVLQVLFMESYSVARRIASTNNELHILNASQELIANGVANLLGSVSSAYPVSGSFSRSSLNQCTSLPSYLLSFLSSFFLTSLLSSFFPPFLSLPFQCLFFQVCKLHALI